MKAVIIGAGFGGLASAIALGGRGFDVTVLESASGPGGKAGEAWSDGVAFDTGPSLLTMPEVVRTLFTMSGHHLEDHLALVRHEQPFTYRFEDGVVLNIFHEPEQTIEGVAATLGPAAGEELRRYLDYARGIWEAAAPAFVFGPAPGMGTLLGTDLRTLVGLRSIDAVSTMRGAIRRRVASQHLRAVLMRYATYNGSDARCAPATLNCIAHVELALGGYGVCGGMYALVRALEKLAESVGVRFRYSESVTTIQTARRRVQAVVTESGHHPADIVVSNADVAHLMCDLLGRRQGAAAESMSGWTAVFAASQRASSPGAARSAHTVLMPDRYDREFVDVFDGHTVPSTPALYACDQAVAHERAGWKDGRVPMFAMVNAPVARHVDDYDWAWLESQVRDRLTRADLIDAADPVVWRRTPRMLATRFPGTDGAIYGAASNSPLSAFRRPANRVKGVGGLYVASGSAHPGGGVPLCLLSGLAAARAVVRDVRGADEAARL